MKNGQNEEVGDLGVPLFLETPRYFLKSVTQGVPFLVHWFFTKFCTQLLLQIIDVRGIWFEFTSRKYSRILVSSHILLHWSTNPTLFSYHHLVYLIWNKKHIRKVTPGAISFKNGNHAKICHSEKAKNSLSSTKSAGLWMVENRKG